MTVNKWILILMCGILVITGCNANDEAARHKNQTEKKYAEIDIKRTALSKGKDRMLNIIVRNVSFPVNDPGGNNLLQHYKLRERQLSIPLKQTALFLMDTWDSYNPRFKDAMSVNIAKEIKPLLDIARELDVLVMYSPSRPIGYDGKLAQEKNIDLRGPADTPRSEIPEWIKKVEVPANLWPPIEFIYRVGEYSQYSRYSNPSYIPYTTVLGIHKDILPKKRSKEFIENKLGTIMKIFKENKILHIFYVGEATNQCIVQRDVGIRNMASLGFNTIIVRDATIGTELNSTFETQQITKAAILDIEMNNGFSVSKENLLNALESIKASM
jgi:nicotinamidase-related amidase